MSRLRAALKPSIRISSTSGGDTQIEIPCFLHLVSLTQVAWSVSGINCSHCSYSNCVSVNCISTLPYRGVWYSLNFFKNSMNAFHDLVSTVNTWNCLKLTKVSLNSMLCLPQLHNSFLQSPWITAKPPLEIRLDVKFGSLEARNASLARRLAKHDPVHTSTILACHSHLCHGFLCSP